MKTLNLAKATPVQLTEELQCPGCVIGSDTACGNYRVGPHGQCAAHAMGTMMTGAGIFALGFPKGFCRPGFEIDGHSPYGPPMNAEVRTWTINGVKLETEVGETYGGLGGDSIRFNVPVARTTWHGRAVVLVHSPRTNRLTALLYEKALSAEDEKILSGVIWLDTSALDEDGPSPKRKVGVDFKRPFEVRFWTNGEKPIYGIDKVATWALEQDGLLFVRVCRPETAELWVDVVAGGKRAELAPNAVDVGEFIGEID